MLHCNFWYLHINSLLEWRFYYFHMFRNPINQFMHLNPFPTVKTFTWTGAERHAWRNRYWRSRGQIVYRRNHRNGARLLQRTLKYSVADRWADDDNSNESNNFLLFPTKNRQHALEWFLYHWKINAYPLVSRTYLYYFSFYVIFYFIFMFY